MTALRPHLSRRLLLLVGGVLLLAVGCTRQPHPATQPPDPASARPAPAATLFAIVNIEVRPEEDDPDGKDDLVHRLRRYDLPSRDLSFTGRAISGLPNPVKLGGLAFDPTGRELVTVGSNGRQYRIDPDTAVARDAGPVSVPKPLAESVAVTPEGTLLLAHRKEPRVVIGAGGDFPLKYAAGDPLGGVTPWLAGLATTRDGALYGVGNERAESTSLVHIDASGATRGTTRTIGLTGLPRGGQASELDFATDGTLFALLDRGRDSPEGFELHTINPGTGATTWHGDLLVHDNCCLIMADTEEQWISGIAVGPAGQFDFGTDVSVAEGEPARVVVSRSGGTFGRVSVDWVVAGGVALPGGDLRTSGGTLTFEEGQQEASLQLPTIEDDEDEPDEEAVLRLIDPTRTSIVTAGARAVVTVVDDDAAPAAPAAPPAPPAAGFRFATNPTVVEDTTSVGVEIQRTGDLSGPASVDFSTSDGTASSADGDYSPASTTVAFAAGVSTRTVPVFIGEDTVDEGDETVFLRLTNPSVGSPSTGTLTIVDDDAPVQLDAETYPASEGEQVVVTATRTSTSGARTITYESGAPPSGTAADGGDFTGATGTLDFADGDASESFTVTITDDTVDEPEERFALTLREAGTALDSAVVVIAASDAPAVAAWREESVTGPPARFEHGMAYDGLNGPTVVFGGADSDETFGDTWTWNGAWQLATPASTPSPRRHPTLATDPDAGVVLFGGSTPGPSGAPTNETWVWNGTTWTEKPQTVTVPAFLEPAMAYSPLNDEVVMLGGTATGSETWVWDGDAWLQLFPTTSPPAREGAVLALDYLNNLVLFGGRSMSGTPLDDTWTWNGVDWTASTGDHPGARSQAVMAYDADGQETVLFGGTSGSGETWTWDGSAWTLESAGSSSDPAGRTRAGMAIGAGGDLVLFGGMTAPEPGTELGDTWQHGSSGDPPPTPVSSSRSVPVAPPLVEALLALALLARLAAATRRHLWATATT